MLAGLSEGSYQVSYTYDTYGQVATVQISQGATLYQAAYTYDLLGRISKTSKRSVVSATRGATSMTRWAG